MDSFSSFDASSGGGMPTLNRSSVEESLKVIQMQAAMQQQELLVQTINEKCFKMCVSSPGSSLDTAQQKCLAKCVDRYVEAWNCVSKTVTNKIRQQAGMM